MRAWLMSGGQEAGPLALFVLFQAHYLQRAFIFPLLLRRASRRCRWGSS